MKRKHKPLVVPKSKPRNPLVPAVKQKTGAGKHINRKKQQRNEHHE